MLTSFRVLSNCNFRLFLTVQTLSVMGSWMQLTALGWLLYRLSGSAYIVAVLVFLNQIPVLLLSPVAGSLADRLDRRRLLLCTQSTSFAVTLSLAAAVLLHKTDVFWLLSLVAASGIVYALDLPARQSFLCDLVGKEQLRYAIILNSLSFHLARMLGPLFAGILISSVGESWCIFLNSFSFLAVALTLFWMKKDLHHHNEPIKDHATGVMHGLYYVWKQPALSRILLLLSIVSFLGAQHSTFIPVLTRQNFHEQAKGLGLLMGAPGIGALAAALMLLFRSSNNRLGSLLPAMTAGSGVALVLLAWSTHMWVAEILLIVLGFCITFQNAASNILLQEDAPEWIRGRIMALFSMAFMGLMPVGAFALGFASRHARVSTVLTVAGMTCAIVTLVVEGLFRANIKPSSKIAAPAN
jgi:MFS family permease